MAAILPQDDDAASPEPGRRQDNLRRQLWRCSAVCTANLDPDHYENEPETWTRHKNLLKAIIGRAYSDLLQLPPPLWQSWKAEIVQREKEAIAETEPKRKEVLLQNFYTAQAIYRNAKDAYCWLTVNSNSRWSYSWMMNLLGKREPEEIRVLKNT